MAFAVGTKVWAKMAGFPAWPAKVMRTINAPRQKNKPFAVIFYGEGHQVAWMEEKQLSVLGTEAKKGMNKQVAAAFAEAMEDKGDNPYFQDAASTPATAADDAAADDPSRGSPAKRKPSSDDGASAKKAKRAASSENGDGSSSSSKKAARAADASGDGGSAARKRKASAASENGEDATPSEPKKKKSDAAASETPKPPKVKAKPVVPDLATTPSSESASKAPKERMSEEEFKALSKRMKHNPESMSESDQKRLKKEFKRRRDEKPPVDRMQSLKSKLEEIFSGGPDITPENGKRAQSLLEQIRDFEISPDVLKETMIAKSIKKLRKMPKEQDKYGVVPLCEDILEKWRRYVDALGQEYEKPAAAAGTSATATDAAPASVAAAPVAAVPAAAEPIAAAPVAAEPVAAAAGDAVAAAPAAPEPSSAVAPAVEAPAAEAPAAEAPAAEAPHPAAAPPAPAASALPSDA